jgi:hypothetical protein
MKTRNVSSNAIESPIERTAKYALRSPTGAAILIWNVRSLFQAVKLRNSSPSKIASAKPGTPDASELAVRAPDLIEHAGGRAAFDLRADRKVTVPLKLEQLVTAEREDRRGDLPQRGIEDG